MDRTCSTHVLPMFYAYTFHGNSMNNLLSYCGLVDARIRASEKRFTCTKKNGPPEIISTNCTHQEHSTYYLLNYLAIYKTNFSEILTT